MDILETRKLIAEKFCSDLQLKTNFENLIQMVQMPYLQALSKEFTGDDCLTKFSDGRGFQSMFGSKYTHSCQKAFLDKLIEVTAGDKDILLAFVSLRRWWRSDEEWGFAWGQYLDEGCREGPGHSELKSTYGLMPHRLGMGIIQFLTPTHLPAVDMTLPAKYSPDHYHPRTYISHIVQLRAKYEFTMVFSDKLLATVLDKLVAKLETFGALRQLYGSKQHVNDVGVVLLTHACDFATTTEELILVTRWLLNANRTQTVHLKKRLKPLLKKLIATL